MAIITLNNNSLSSVTSLPAAVPIGVDGISSNATSDFLHLTSDNRLGVDHSTYVYQKLSATGFNGQATEDWLRIGQTWMCGGTWSGSRTVSCSFDLNANTSFIFHIAAYGYGSGIDYKYGTYRVGTDFSTTLENNGSNSVTYTTSNNTNTFTTGGMTHGTYFINLTGNLDGGIPLVTVS
jgi:hypothetical protein